MHSYSVAFCPFLICGIFSGMRSGMQVCKYTVGNDTDMDKKEILLEICSIAGIVLSMYCNKTHKKYCF